MPKTLAAVTTAATTYPGYVNFAEQEDGSVVVTTRGDPSPVEGVYVCGFYADRHKPGRCFPGGDNCNNYCNLAPQKGPMPAGPLRCTQVLVGPQASTTLSAAEWQSLKAQIAGA